MAERIWECDYHHDRRQHRHRCRACWKIIEAGERVVMARKAKSRGTVALHAGCAEMRHSPTYTWREVFQEWFGNPFAQVTP